MQPPKDTDDNVVTLRTKEGRFPKGVSGNPAGKPKAYEIGGEKIEITKLYKQRGPQVAEKLWKLIESSKTSAQTKMAAIREWNQRAYGMPKETVETINGTGTEEGLFDWSQLPDEIKRAILNTARKSGT